MDVVLEIFDHFVGDRLYASFLPAFPPQTTLTPGKEYLPYSNGTDAYTYHPASQYLSLEPSDFAYMSQWNRNNVYRQTLSLFFITL